MWRIYLTSEEGIAIRSTTGRLERALSAASETVFLGSVRYLDYDKESVPDAHDLDPFFCKRTSYDYEREVRAVWCVDGRTEKAGRYLGVDLHALVDAIVVSPTAERWFEELVRSVTQRYGFDLPVDGSSMRDPSWLD